MIRYTQAFGQIAEYPKQLKNDILISLIAFFTVFFLMAFPILNFQIYFHWISLLFTFAYLFLAFGLSLRFTEHLLTFIFKPCHPPLSPHPIQPNKIAVVMTICNDVQFDILDYLIPIATAGYDVFLLDDSLENINFPNHLRPHVKLIRRTNRNGAKAGNLNHWLRQYAEQYSFLCILDSDSVMPLDSLNKLSRAAAHPTNTDIAVFQAKIVEAPHHTPSLQARLTGLSGFPRARMLSRVHNRFQMVLSHGHNQLVRISALQIVNGFNELSSHEDTILSFELGRLGYKTSLLDVWSYDKEPTTFEAHCRRTIRWARQTIELFKHPWIGVPLRQKLIVCDWLFAYFTPFLIIMLLGVSIWIAPVDAKQTFNITKKIWICEPGYGQLSLIYWSGLGVYTANLTLQFFLARTCQLHLGLIFLSWIHGIATMTLLSIPLALYMGLTAMGYKTPFIPTNTTASHLINSQKRQIYFIWLSGVFISLLFLTGALIHPGSLVLGLTGVWSTLSIVAPLVIIAIKMERQL